MIGSMGRVWIAVIVIGLLGAALVEMASGQGGYGEDGGYGEARDPLRFGTVLQRDLDDDESRLMRDGGLDSVRFWLSWAGSQPRREYHDWSEADETVREIAAAGLTPIPFLFGTPAWAANGDEHECERADCMPFAPITLESRSAFAAFAGEAVHRYGPDGVFWERHPELPYRPLRVWQLWNEPNLQAFWRPYVDARGYAELVRLAAAEIRAVDPEAEVVLGGFSGNRSTKTRWSAQAYLEQLYAVPGVAESFDGVAIHPYASRTRGVLDRIRNALAITAVHDPEVDLWITEIGWASAGPEVWSLVKTIDGQAKLLRRSFTRLMGRADDWNLRGLYWYAWRDTDVGKAVCGWCARAGLRDRKGRPKPAFHELRRVTVP
jgi:hypothetical protein